jgi:hypothetical protein
VTRYGGQHGGQGAPGEEGVAQRLIPAACGTCGAEAAADVGMPAVKSWGGT